MEPIGISVAAVSAAACAAAARVAGRSEWAKQVQLPRVLAKTVDGDEVLPLLAVHIRRVELSPQYTGKRLRTHVKYGQKRAALRCETDSFAPALPEPQAAGLVRIKSATVASAELSSTCLFLLNEIVEPVVRLTVSKAGLPRRDVAKASISLMDLAKGGKVELPLLSASQENIGRVFIGCDVMEVRQRELVRSLALVCADDQSDAFVVAGAETKLVSELVGDLVDGHSDNSDIADIRRRLQC
mmetsp:Transcript_75800/g.190661  ORF Transcript_75800/g.190661 Transcript_75800/m.190661 type:complete len:242 (-) Transcript_75800:361-1086(-)